MVKGVIEGIRASMKYRGGWKGFYEHMYTNADYPFKFGSYMGADVAGNRYYENRVDYPFGQHRWVEPGDIHNFDSTSIPPEWHGWMTSMNDSPPSQEQDYLDESKKNILKMCHSDAPDDHAVGFQHKLKNFHSMHNQSQVRSRGYGIGNPVVGLPPFNAKDSYYTQPGSPYNEASIRKHEPIGQLDADGRHYKSDKWADRLRTEEERLAYKTRFAAEQQKLTSKTAVQSKKVNRLKLLKSRGRGTIV